MLKLKRLVYKIFLPKHYETRYTVKNTVSNILEINNNLLGGL